MHLELPIPWIIALNVLGWPVIQVGLAWAWTQAPPRWFQPPPPSAFERDGFYERFFFIRSWKDRLPDAAPWFRAGFAKGSMTGASPAYLERFIRETWRGELCHWSALAFVPLFFLWNPWWGNLIILAYALAANLPCIVAQRYNRIRLYHALARKNSLSQCRKV